MTSSLPPGLRHVVSVALGAWVVLLAVTLLAPSAEGPSWLVDTVLRVAERLGAPSALTTPERVELGLNVVAFVPVSFLGSLLWSRPKWRDWTAVGFVASLVVEVVQAVALDGRSATHSDVVANTLGALVGAVLGGLVTIAVRSEGSSEGRADLPDRVAPSE